MSAAPITNADVDAWCRTNCIPPGYKYGIILISFTKRLLAADRPPRERLEFLEYLNEPSADHWLSTNMIATVAAMDDDGFKLAAEALKLGDKGLDVIAKHFPTFAVLNPSLLASLQMMPGMKTAASVEVL
jgi:hypothetical protein